MRNGSKRRTRSVEHRQSNIDVLRSKLEMPPEKAFRSLGCF